MYRVILVALVLTACVLPGCVSQAENSDYQYYHDTSRLFGKLGDSSLKITQLIDAEEYSAVKIRAEDMITAIDAYKLNSYDLTTSQAKQMDDEVESALKFYTYGLMYLIQAMDSLMAGDVATANKLLELSTVDIREAEKHIIAINKLLP